jgi:small subunit ribosomal protein S29
MPGERKASRKRVVLSNTNALEVAWLKDFDKVMLEEIIKTGSLQKVDGAATEGQGQSVLGKVVGLTGETVDALRAVEAFKSNQGWGLFRRPGVLLREESVQLSRRIVEAEKGKSTLRLVVDGDKGAGKSLMLVHALATAHLRGWIVMTVPEGMSMSVQTGCEAGTNHSV